MSELLSEARADFEVRLQNAVFRMRQAETPQAFTEAERELHALTRQVAARITQRVLQDLSDDETRKRAAFDRIREKGASRGIRIRVERKRRTQVRTLGGDVVEVETPYATARPRGELARATRGAQGTGVYPVLDQLGIVGRSTPALRFAVSYAVCEANSVKSAREILEKQGVEIDHKAALRLTYLVSDDALRARAKAMRAIVGGNDDGAYAGRRVVVAVDGGRVNIRRRVAGRPRKGGRKKFVTEWREPKLLTLYVLDENGKRDRTVEPVIDGTLGDADAAFDLVRYHLLRVGAHLATELVVVADGAKWIWNRTGELRQALGLPEDRVTEVVDYFHVAERLTELSKSRPRWSDDQRQAWLSEQKEHLNEGSIEEIEAAVKVLLNGKRKELTTELAYWSRNRERLRYAAFREAGLPVGSGAVESSVRRVINLRLKGASITWTEEHAEGILHLRAHAKSGRWCELEEAVLDEAGWRPTARQVSKSA